MMEITINTVDGQQKQVKVVKCFYYTISGKRVKFCIHETLHMLGCYTITHVKSAIRVRDYPKYRHLVSFNAHKEMLKELIDSIGEEKMKAALIKAGEIFK